MTTAKELTLALALGVRIPGEEKVYDWNTALQDEGDWEFSMGTIEWVDSFRDPDEPGTWVVLFRHEGLLYAVYGSYDSWNGIDYWDNELHPVEEVQVTTSRYNKRKES